MGRPDTITVTVEPGDLLNLAPASVESEAMRSGRSMGTQERPFA